MTLWQPGSDRNQSAICSPKNVSATWPISKIPQQLLSSQRSRCLFKDDALKIVLPGRVLRWLKTSLFVRSAVPALVARTVDRWHRNCFHQSSPQSARVDFWLVTSHSMLLSETSPARAGTRSKTYNKIIESRGSISQSELEFDFQPQTFLERDVARVWPPPLKITALSYLLLLPVTESPLQR